MKEAFWILFIKKTCRSRFFFLSFFSGLTAGKRGSSRDRDYLRNQAKLRTKHFALCKLCAICCCFFQDANVWRGFLQGTRLVCSHVSGVAAPETRKRLQTLCHFWDICVKLKGCKKTFCPALCEAFLPLSTEGKLHAAAAHLSANSRSALVADSVLVTGLYIDCSFGCSPPSPPSLPHSLPPLSTSTRCDPAAFQAWTSLCGSSSM